MKWVVPFLRSPRAILASALGAALVTAVAIPPAESTELDILTAAANATISPDLMVVRITGDITAGTTEKLHGAWAARSPAISRLLLDLNSIGGEIPETERIVALIRDLRKEHRVDTLVRHGSVCASACIALFAQGERRIAGGSSVWMFHGVCPSGSNVPSFSQTCRAFEMLRTAGVREAFLLMLMQEGYVTHPGSLWASGYELVHRYDAGLITRLLDPWQAEEPVYPSSR